MLEKNIKPTPTDKQIHAVAQDLLRRDKGMVRKEVLTGTMYDKNGGTSQLQTGEVTHEIIVLFENPFMK